MQTRVRSCVDPDMYILASTTFCLVISEREEKEQKKKFRGRERETVAGGWE